MPPQFPEDLVIAREIRNGFPFSPVFWPSPRARRQEFSRSSSDVWFPELLEQTARFFAPGAFGLGAGGECRPEVGVDDPGPIAGKRCFRIEPASGDEGIEQVAEIFGADPAAGPDAGGKVAGEEAHRCASQDPSCGVAEALLRRAGEVGEEVAGLGQQELADEDGGAFDGGLGNELAVGVIEQMQDEGPAGVCAVELGAGALEARAIVGEGSVAAAVAFGLSDDIACGWAGPVALCLAAWQLFRRDVFDQEAVRFLGLGSVAPFIGWKSLPFLEAAPMGAPNCGVFLPQRDECPVFRGTGPNCHCHRDGQSDLWVAHCRCPRARRELPGHKSAVVYSPAVLTIP